MGLVHRLAIINICKGNFVGIYFPRSICKKGFRGTILISHSKLSPKAHMICVNILVVGIADMSHGPPGGYADMNDALCVQIVRNIIFLILNTSFIVACKSGSKYPMANPLAIDLYIVQANRRYAPLGRDNPILQLYIFDETDCAGIFFFCWRLDPVIFCYFSSTPIYTNNALSSCPFVVFEQKKCNLKLVLYFIYQSSIIILNQILE